MTRANRGVEYAHADDDNDNTVGENEDQNHRQGGADVAHTPGFYNFFGGPHAQEAPEEEAVVGIGKSRSHTTRPGLSSSEYLKPEMLAENLAEQLAIRGWKPALNRWPAAPLA